MANLLVVFNNDSQFERAVEFFQNSPAEECPYAPEITNKEFRSCYFETHSEGETDNLEMDLNEILIKAGFSEDGYHFELEHESDEEEANW